MSVDTVGCMRAVCVCACSVLLGLGVLVRLGV